LKKGETKKTKHQGMPLSRKSE